MTVCKTTALGCGITALLQHCQEAINLLSCRGARVHAMCILSPRPRLAGYWLANASNGER